MPSLSLSTLSNRGFYIELESSQQPSPFFSLYSQPSSGVLGMQPHWEVFFMGVGDLNSGLQACSASAVNLLLSLLLRIR